MPKKFYPKTGHDDREPEVSIQSPTQLKVACTNALMEAGEIPEIQSPHGGTPAAGVKKKVSASKGGRLILPKEQVEELESKVRDLFLERKNDVGILLKLG